MQEASRVAERTAMRIAILAPARTGAALACRLSAVGHEVVHSDEICGQARASGACDSGVCALANRCDAVITRLEAHEGTQAYDGPCGLLASHLEGKLVVEMGEVPSGRAHDRAARVKAAGGVFVECQVLGTLGEMKAGRMLGFAAGSVEDVAKARPILDQICTRIDYLGAAGTATAARARLCAPLMCV